MLSKRSTTNKQTTSGSVICVRLSCAPTLLAKTVMLMLLFASSVLAQANLGTISLVNSFETAQDMAMITPSSVSVAQVTDHVTDGKYALQVNFQVADYPDFRFDFSKQPRDWSAFGGVAFDVYNPTSDSITLKIRMDDDAITANVDPSHTAIQSVIIGGHSGGRALFLFGSLTSPSLMGMQVGPPVAGYSVMQMQGSSSINFAHITSFMFYLSLPQAPETLILDNVRLFTATADSLISYVGIVDQYGQFTKESWPGKVTSDSDITAQAQAEANLPLPDRSGQDQYGGTLSLPAVSASGFFRTTRDSGGRWWFVTPAGHLFFSTGICETSAYDTYTDVQGRSQLFTSLPDPSGPFAAFYEPAGSGAPPPVGSGVQFTNGQSFSFYGANTLRKYGSGYQQAWNRATIDRLTRWGINTIGKSSNPSLFTATGSVGQRVPYAVQLSYSGSFAQVVTPYDLWSHMTDPFDPAFATAVDTSLAKQIAGYVTDPYLLGYFVDNELSWAGGMNDPRDPYRYALVYGVLAATSASPAKNAFVQALRTEYSDIARLNQVWQTNFASWDALLSTPYTVPATIPNVGMRQDFSSLLVAFAEQYFRTISATIRKYDSHHLYLGSQFANFALETVQACSEFCDVISFNTYAPRLDPATWAFVHQFGKPAMVSEFHFGATDRGGFWGGYAPVSSQVARALAHGLKIQDIATNPDFVGAHWFQYVDQPVAGRTQDGENGAVGFVSVADLPYPEFTASATLVNSMVYNWRTLPSQSSQPVPAIGALSPTSAATGSGDLQLTVAGSNFSPGSTVLWNGSARQTLYINNTQLWVLIPAGDLSSAQVAQATVSTPAPGGGASNAVAFVVCSSCKAPVITGVSNAAGGQVGVASGAFVSIYGSSFTTLAYDDWGKSITNGQLPTQLDGVSVTIGGKPAYINAITPGQINVQAPDLGAGPSQVVVTTAGGVSAPFSTTAQAYSPAFFLWPGSQPVATHTDYTLAVKDGTFPGATTVAAKPGEAIILWGTGFGPTAPAVAAGQEPTVVAPPTQSPVSVALGSASVPVIAAVLSGYVAEYQIAIQIPANQPDGDYPIVAAVGGAQSPSNVVLSVHH